MKNFYCDGIKMLARIIDNELFIYFIWTIIRNYMK